MSRSTAEILRERKIRTTRPTSLDLAQIHGNDYSTINKAPNTLWDFWEKEEAILGQLSGTEQFPWYAAYPGIQYVHNNPESTHIVIAPRRDDFVTPKDLSVEDTSRATAFVQNFLRSRDKQAYAGYNIGPEKDGSQMWWSWHIHLVQFGERELQALTSRPRIVWEPWPAHIEDIMARMFLPKLLAKETFPQGEKVELSELDRFGFSSFGSSLIRFGKNISPGELATVMIEADIEYKKLHGELKDIFFDNTEKGSLGRKREPDDMRIRLKEYADLHDLPNQTGQSLTNFGEGVLPDVLPETPSRNSPLTVPNYSVAILSDDNGTYFLFQPHIFRKKASALSSLGIFLDYELDTSDQRLSDYKRKKARNMKLVKDINDSLQTEVA